MLGKSLADQDVSEPRDLNRVFVKGPVFPFRRFPLSDRLLGPEMKSTGEVMGIGHGFGEAYSKAQVSTGVGLPDSGTAFISVNDRDKTQAVEIARGLSNLGFSLVATRGTRDFLVEQGLACEAVAKVNEGRPDIAELIHQGKVQLVLNTPLGKQSHFDEEAIRRAATLTDVVCITTLSGGRAAVDGIVAQREARWSFDSLQELHS
jgi:carbamoyl-phosphate synthase large subunit